MSKTKEEIGIIKNRKKREAAAKYAKEQRDVPAKKYAEDRGKKMAGKIDKVLAGKKDVRHIVKSLHDDPLEDAFPMTKKDIKVKAMEKGIEEGTKEIKRKEKQRNPHKKKRYGGKIKAKKYREGGKVSYSSGSTSGFSSKFPGMGE